MKFFERNGTSVCVAWLQFDCPQQADENYNEVQAGIFNIFI